MYHYDEKLCGNFRVALDYDCGIDMLDHMKMVAKLIEEEQGAEKGCDVEEMLEAWHDELEALDELYETLGA